MPKGAAGEYSKYACNFYKGCSNGCTYCYLQRGVLKHACGGGKPVLKSCFVDEDDALIKYLDDLSEIGAVAINEDIRKHGVFFTFTSDPCLPETIHLNFAAIVATIKMGIPVTILTKRADWIDTERGKELLSNCNAKTLLSVGFTLTGCDDLEPNASPNVERIEAMKRIHAMGIRTWASIEPVVSLEASRLCVMNTLGFCDEYKIGLLTGGKRDYSQEEVAGFVKRMERTILDAGSKVYWKESVRKFVGVE